MKTKTKGVLYIEYKARIAKKTPNSQFVWQVEKSSSR